MHLNTLISRLAEYADRLPLSRLSCSQKYSCAWVSSDKSKEYFQNIQLFFLRKYNCTLNNLSPRAMTQKPPIKNSTILFELNFTIFSIFSNPLILLFIWIMVSCIVWIMSRYNYPEVDKVNKLKLNPGNNKKSLMSMWFLCLGIDSVSQIGLHFSERAVA